MFLLYVQPASPSSIEKQTADISGGLSVSQNLSKTDKPNAVCKTVIVSPGLAGRAGFFPEQNAVLRSEKMTRNLDKVAVATLSTR